MHILVTGIAGFVGSRLARHLLARGDRVSGTYIDARPDLPGVELFEADLLDRAALERAVREAGPDAVVNLAGLSHIGESWNGSGCRLLPGQRRGDRERWPPPPEGRRVVIASSADVYGARAARPSSRSPRIPPRRSRRPPTR